MAMMAMIGQQSIVPGIYHFSNEGQCTWYDFAVKIMELANLDCHVYPIETHQYPTRAIRPIFSVLDKKKITQLCNLTIPQWEQSLEKCITILSC
jgi:dTDP-4-dehydrorhamnose reductase